MILTASLLRAQQNRDSVENKPASLLVESLGKALNGMPPFSNGRQMVGRAVYPSWWPSLTEDLQTEHERTALINSRLNVWCGPRPRLGWVEMTVGLPEGPSYHGHSPSFFRYAVP